MGIKTIHLPSTERKIETVPSTPDEDVLEILCRIDEPIRLDEVFTFIKGKDGVHEYVGVVKEIREDPMGIKLLLEEPGTNSIEELLIHVQPTELTPDKMEFQKTPLTISESGNSFWRSIFKLLRGN